MVRFRSGRSRLPAIAAVGLVCSLLVGQASAADEVVGAPVHEVDVAGFSNRAAEWTRASAQQRVDALQRAEALGEETRQAEETERILEQQRLEEAEARRQAEAAAAATSTTTTTTVAPTTTAPPTSVPASTTTAASVEDTAPESTATAPVGGPSAAQWEALRGCESGGRYDAVNPNGRYRGAYQFSQATWDWVAGIASPGLIGVDPAAAAPADQDALALKLWELRGSSPWPTCGVHLN